MIINLTFDPGTVNATSLGSNGNLNAFKAQINAAAQLFSSTFLDPVSLNITVKYGPVSLGESSQSFYPYSLATAKDALKKDITSLDDLKTANAVGSGAGTVYLTHAQLKALGLIAGDAPGSDGTITISSTPGLVDFTHSSAMAATSYDLFGVAAHEISEIMGRVSDVTLNSGIVAHTILTQFNTGGHFTIGSETLLKFNTIDTGDRGDWDNSVSTNDAFRAFAMPGKVSDVSIIDMRALDVIGWDRKAFDFSNVDIAEALYIGYFGRAGDPGGMKYWTDALNAGFTPQATAASFSVQVESKMLYPFLAHPSTASPFDIDLFINSVYHDLFNRGAEPGGLAYWHSYLSTHLGNPQAVGSFILDVIYGAQNSAIAHDRTAFINKLAAAENIAHSNVGDVNSDLSTPITGVLSHISASGLSFEIGI